MKAVRILPDTAATRVVLVDDHAVVRQGLRLLLESSGGVRVVGEAGEPQEALDLVRSEQPHVVLLDLRLGEEDGMDVARGCNAVAPETKVLVVSAHGSSAELRRALAGGADGYLLKGVTGPELVEGINRVAAGETVIDPSFVPALLHQMSNRDEQPATPTVREMEILSLVADGLTAQQVAERLGLSQRTVQKHLENLYRKLGVSNRAEVIRQAFRMGLLQ